MWAILTRVLALLNLITLLIHLTATCESNTSKEGNFKLKDNTLRGGETYGTFVADHLARCVALCIESLLCQCFNYNKATSTCRLIFYERTTGVFDSQLTADKEWVLGCSMFGRYFKYTHKRYGITASCDIARFSQTSGCIPFSQQG